MGMFKNSDPIKFNEKTSCLRKMMFFCFAGSGWWPSLAQMMDMQLREIEVVPRHFFIMPDDKVAAEIEEKLQVLRKYPCRGKLSLIRSQ